MVKTLKQVIKTKTNLIIGDIINIQKKENKFLVDIKDKITGYTYTECELVNNLPDIENSYFTYPIKKNMRVLAIIQYHKFYNVFIIGYLSNKTKKNHYADKIELNYYNTKIIMEKDKITLSNNDNISIVLENDKITLNGGITPTARQGDKINITATTDSAFITWIATVSNLLNIQTYPTIIKGEIIEGNDKVVQ